MGEGGAAVKTAQIVMLLVGLAYLDFAIWYSAEMHNIWYSKKRKFLGVLFRFWDFIGKAGET